MADRAPPTREISLACVIHAWKGLSSDNCDLELHWTLRLVLHDEGSVGYLIAMGHVADF